MTDLHVIADDKQFVKNDLQNRNRIRMRDGVKWITVPVQGRSSMKKINEMLIAGSDWRSKHIGMIEQSYRTAPCFKKFWPDFLQILSEDWIGLADLDVAIQNLILRSFNFRKTKMLLGSELQIEGKRGEYLFNLCKELDADVYVTTPNGKKYLPEDKFERAGIQIFYHIYEEEQYAQVFPGFEPRMSAIDRLFCTGKPKSIEPSEILNINKPYMP